MKSKFQKFNCFNHLVYLLVRLFCVDFMFVVLCFLMVVIFHFVTVCANVRYKCSLVVILYFCQWVSFTVRKLEIWLPIKYLRSIHLNLLLSENDHVVKSLSWPHPEKCTKKCSFLWFVMSKKVLISLCLRLDGKTLRFYTLRR